MFALSLAISGGPLLASSKTFFSDSFESGNFANWTTVDKGLDKWAVLPGLIIKAQDGKRDAEVSRAFRRPTTDWKLSKATSTSGHNNINLSFHYLIPRAGNLESNDHLLVEWFDGSNWQQIADITNTNTGIINRDSWKLASYNLPAEAGNNPAFAFRLVAKFSPNSKGLDNLDTFIVDNVVLSGEKNAQEPSSFVIGSQGEGPGQFDRPVKIGLDKNGNIYVVDSHDFDDQGNNRVQKFNSDGVYLSSWWTSGTDQRINQSSKGLAFDVDGNIYISTMTTYGVYHIKKFSPSGELLATLGDSLTGLANSGSNLNSFNIAVDRLGNIYAAMSGINKIQKFNSNGEFLSEWGSFGDANGQFNTPVGISVDNLGNIYVSDWGNSRVQKFDLSGNFLSKWHVQYPKGLALDSLNNIYVSSVGNGSRGVKKFDGNGVLIKDWPELVADELDVDSSSLYITDSINYQIKKVAI